MIINFLNEQDSMFKNIHLIVCLTLISIVTVRAMDANTTFSFARFNTIKRAFIQKITDPLNNKKIAELEQENAQLRQELRAVSERRARRSTLIIPDSEPSSHFAWSIGLGALSGVTIFIAKQLLISKTTTTKR